MTLEQLQVILAILLAIGGITYGVCVKFLNVKNKLVIVLAYCAFSACVVGAFYLVNTHLVGARSKTEENSAEGTTAPAPKEQPKPGDKTSKDEGGRAFKGKSTYDPKTRQLMLHYDFRDAKQLEDFDVVDSKPTVKGGFLVLYPGDVVRHKPKYVTVKMTGLINLRQYVGNHFRTTGGYKFDCHPHSGSACYMTIDNGGDVGERIAVDPRVANGDLTNKPVSFEFNLKETEISGGLAQFKVSASPKQRVLAPAGQIELQGGESGKSYGGITITGQVDADWARLFIDEK